MCIYIGFCIYIHICMYYIIYTHAIKISEKIDHRFEGRQGEIYGGGLEGGKSRERCCNYIITTKNLFIFFTSVI